MPRLSRLIFFICGTALLPGALSAKTDATVPEIRYLRLKKDPGLLFLRSNPELQKGMRRARSGSLNFGSSDSIFWGSIKLQNHSHAYERRLVEVAYPALDLVELYVPRGDRITVKRAGDLRPFGFRDISHRHHVFRVDLKPGEALRVYLRVSTTSFMQIPIRVHSESGFRARERTEQYMLGFYYGLLFVMAVYNLFLFTTIRDRPYLYYALYVATFILGQMCFQGLAVEFLWPQAQDWNNRSIPAAVGLNFVFMMQFTRSFLNLREHARKADLILLVLMAAISVYIVLVLLLPIGALVSRVGNVFILSITSVCLVSGTLRAYAGYRPAVYYLIAWCLLLISAIVLGLKNAEVLPSNFITNYGIHFGSALEVVLLSFALADRINLLKQEKEQAQLKLKEGLEQQVRERTVDLNRSLENLREKDRRMQFYLDVAARIQDGFLPRTPLDFPEWRIVARHEYKEKVGGDFFDVLPAAGGRRAVFMADVSGHGVPAALVTVAAKIGFMNAVARHSSPREVLARVNRTLRNTIKTEEYMTAFFILLGSRGEVSFGTAGHVPALLWRLGSESLEEWDTSGMFLGVLDDDNIVLHEKENRLNPGDRLFIYTDGIADSRDSRGEPFGEERLREMFLSHARRDLEELPAAMTAYWRNYVGPKADDDATFLVIEARRLEASD